MTHPTENKRILLGVSGSIATFKAVDLASKLTQAGAIVDVILTAGAEKFVTPLSFQSVTGRQAYTDADLWGASGHVTHVGLGHSADLLVIAPATANTIAKLAHGIGDNLLTVTALVARCRLLIAPAMDGGMYAHPATQANLHTLEERGALFIGPEEGHLASGMVGVGRMAEPADILAHIRYVLSRDGTLNGRKIVVTAGGTREPIDPIRVITNRSSGKQGYAVAQAALDAGAEVILISGPTALEPPWGTRFIEVQTAEEMLAAVLLETRTADVLIMAAAVSDFRPVEAIRDKIKKEDGAPQIHLETTEDILAAVARQKEQIGNPVRVVGFAAESRDLLENARSKLHAKRLDLIVANDITATDAGFEVDTNQVTLLFADGRTESLPSQQKVEVARRIVVKVSEWF